ncbi:MAG TPA: ECF-type sigma factor [Pirellulales bacterium]|jgi:RNA polymerase sigma factor (TIGR02999 family)|nr:ECF-type sigma factor [Pirellulales bacterium]
MTDVTRILDAIEAGQPQAARELLPLVYDELRRLAAAKLAHEQPGQTLDATALVHEAYLRLVDTTHVQSWNSRGHFFAAAAEAMRRILVENARRKHAVKRGAGLRRQSLDEIDVVAPETPDDLLALDEALCQLSAADAQAAEVVKLRYYGGLTIREVAAFLGVSPRTADSLWAYARAWLLDKIGREQPPVRPAESRSEK